MNELWEQISGYIMPVLTVLLSSGLGAVLVRAMSSNWFRKHDLNTMAEQFANKLAGSSIKVDLKTITEKQLDKIEKGMGLELADLKEKINMLLSSQGDIIACISSSSKLKKEESNKLLSDLERITKAVEPIESKDEIVIDLKTTEVQQQTAVKKTETKNLIQMG